MDYETADGSQFSLREIWSQAANSRDTPQHQDDEAQFHETIITALVDGKPYVGRSPLPIDELDDADILALLEAVPITNVFPPCPPHFLRAPEPFDSARQYRKAPQFSYDDLEPGQTFVADSLLREATVLEELRARPHANLVRYLGCYVRDGRITHLVLERLDSNLTTLIDQENGISPDLRDQVIDGIEAGLKHLHALGLAHNDLNPYNICLTADRKAVIIDFDSCLPFGRPLLKGVAAGTASDEFAVKSDARNDWEGLRDIEDFLYDNLRASAG